MAVRRKVNTRRIHTQFGLVVAPYLTKWLGGRIYQVEHLGKPTLRCGVPEHYAALDACRILDMGAHIDYLHEDGRGALRGISQRTQEWRPGWAGRWPWNTFTIRQRPRNAGAEVEGDHIRRALTNFDEGVLFPAYQVQAYIRDGGVDSIGMIRTADLYRFVDCPPFDYRLPGAQPVEGGNWMHAIRWDDLIGCGVQVWRWSR